MKDLLKKIKLREKTMTAACRAANGVEWTTYKVNSEGREFVEHQFAAVDLPSEMADVEEGEEAELSPAENLAELIKGEVSVALRASELLTRVMSFPTTDDAEIADMVDFQIDKVSPFPIDQLAIAHEVLRKGEDHSSVLMVAAKRDRVDAIGDYFEKRGVRIHSIDARSLGWLQLLRDEGFLRDTGAEMVIIMDGVDFTLTVLSEGAPIILRSLEIDLEEMTAVDELVREISYTLTTLDAEYDLPTPERVQLWSLTDLPAPLRAKLNSHGGLKFTTHGLDILPPLSEGVARRTLSGASKVELIPREWIEHMNRQRMFKQFGIIAGAVAAVWLIVLIIFMSVFKARDMKLNSTRARANEIAPLAQKAEANQRKLKTLRVYTDRSDSSIECLREITRLMPAGDIEFVSYGYDKNKGVTLRGTGRDKSIVTDFFTTLNDSELFDGIRNESVNDKVTKGVKRAVFSVTLPLAKEEEAK